MPNNYELSYFGISGRAGVARLIFVHAGVEFKDTVFTFQDWGAAKSDRKRFPLGYLPVLKVNDSIISESMAINEYLANEFGLHGNNNLERARVNMVAHALQSLWQNWTKHIFEKDQDVVKKLKEKFYSEQAPSVLGGLEEILKENKGGDSHFVGDRITLADIFLVDVAQVLISCEPTTFDKMPKLKALYERVAAKPAIQKHLSVRKLKF